MQANNLPVEFGQLNIGIFDTGQNEEILNMVFSMALLLVIELSRIDGSRYKLTFSTGAELEQLFDILGILIATRAWKPLNLLMYDLLGILGNLLRKGAISIPEFDRMSKHIRTIQEFLELIDIN